MFANPRESGSCRSRRTGALGKIEPVRDGLQFLAFDATGAVFWSAIYAALGYIFSNQLDRVAAHVARAVARWQRFMREFKLARITLERLRGKLNADEDILLLDLQGRPGSGTKRMAIPGAVRINLAGLSNTGKSRYHALSRSSSIVPVRANSRALVSRSDCGRRGSKTSGFSPADFRDGVIAVSRYDRSPDSGDPAR